MFSMSNRVRSQKFVCPLSLRRSLAKWASLAYLVYHANTYARQKILQSGEEASRIRGDHYFLFPPFEKVYLTYTAEHLEGRRERGKRPKIIDKL